MAYCPKCGNFIPDDAKVCGFCGESLEANEAEVIVDGVDNTGAEAAATEFAAEAEAAADTADAWADQAAETATEGAEAVNEAADAWGAAATEAAEGAEAAATDPWATADTAASGSWDAGAAPAEGTAETTTTTEGTAPADGGTKDAKAGGKKGIVIGAVAAVVVIVLLCCLCGGIFFGTKLFGKTNVKLNKNTIEYSCGEYNKYGEFEIDYTKAKKEYQGKIKYIKGKEIPGYSDPTDALFAKCVKYKAEPGTDLSNGDKVKVTWEIDEQMVKDHFKAKITAKDFEVKVKDLVDVDSFDAFEGVTIEANGINGYGYINLLKRFPADSPSNDFSWAFVYEPMKEAYSNGDEVTVKINYDGIYNMCARTYSKVPESLEKKFTVSGLKEIQDINPFDNVKIEYGGTEPYGTIKITNNNTVDFVNNLRFDIDGGQSGSLSNGDKLKLVARFSDMTGADLVEYGKSRYAVNLTEIYKEITVSELATAETIDPFEGLTLEFKGHEPYGTVRVQKGSPHDVVDGLTFTADKTENLSNGDEITITISRETWGGKEDPEEYALKNGVVLSSLTKTYKVEGLSSYITDMEDLPEETLKAMQKEAVDAWTELGSKMDNYNMTSLDYLGGVILARKGGWSSYSTNTSVYLIYRMNGNIDYKGYDGDCTDAVSSYVWVKFDNIEIVDGAVVANVNKHEESDGYYQKFSYDTGVHYSRYSSDTSKVSLKSYKDLDALGEEVITKNRNNFNYTTNVTGLSEQEPETEGQTEAESEIETESETEEE